MNSYTQVKYWVSVFLCDQVSLEDEPCSSRPVAVFWDATDILIIDYILQGQTMNEKVSKGVLFQHNNARVLTCHLAVTAVNWNCVHLTRLCCW